METIDREDAVGAETRGQTPLWDMAHSEDLGPTQRNQGASVGFQAKDLISHFHVYACTRMCTFAP